MIVIRKVLNYIKVYAFLIFGTRFFFFVFLLSLFVSLFFAHLTVLLHDRPNIISEKMNDTERFSCVRYRP